MTRQNYYAHRKLRISRGLDEDYLIKRVQEERSYQPRLGGRKLLKILKKNGVQIGRDRFFTALREHGLLVEKKRGRKPKTTDSRHPLPYHPNKIRDLEITRPNQVWVSDITYISTLSGFVYASFVTDAYSRKIVGFHAGDSLEAEGCLKALIAAQKQRKGNQKLIHHSDRGSQYCSHLFVNACKKSDIEISMTEINHCYENSLAERINGILKDEYGLDQVFISKSHALKAIKQAVELYNTRRPHMALGMRIPAEVHERQIAA